MRRPWPPWSSASATAMPARPIRASQATDPTPESSLDFLYTDGTSDIVPEDATHPMIYAPAPVSKAGPDGTITYRDALREALAEEMARDGRVIFYGEDVAEYGGAFKLTKGLLETFGRERVFNTPISEATICGTAVGAAIVGLRPVVELMYMDFALMASDQIANQAAKWHFMSGAQVEVPLVVRASVGAGKGYGGQHSQSLESLFTHLPGIWVVYPSTAADAKGLLKAAIRTNNPVLFVESQSLYPTKGVVNGPDHVEPIGVAKVVREGSDVTLVAWGPAMLDALAAAERLAAERRPRCRGHRPSEPRPAGHGHGPRVRPQDRPLRGGQPGDPVRVLRERDRGPHRVRCVRLPRRPRGADRREARDLPQAEGLEKAFLPNADDIYRAVRALL